MWFFFGTPASPPPREMTEQEIKSLRRTVAAYANYRDAAEKDVQRYERSFKKLPPAHKELLLHLGMKYQRLRWCISMNTSFIMNMLEAFEPPFDMNQYADVDDHDSAEHMHGRYHADCAHSADKDDCSRSSLTVDNSLLHAQHDCPREDAKTNESSIENGNKKEEEVHMEGCSHPVGNRFRTSQGVDKPCNGDKIPSACSNCQDKDCRPSSADENVTPGHCMVFPLQSDVPPVDVDEVRRIIRNIVRDWAQEGQNERDECYRPILEELNRLFPSRNKRPPSCLVPGAGLGRLALEISCLGFESQGNELSYYMMICSSFILNHTQKANEWTIYPWVHSNCNYLSDNDQLRPVSFPDIHPSSAGITEGFSMCAGDFVEVYSEKSQESAWDAVVTCFFLDTAHNIVEYIEIISKVLKDGGVWVNLCPLLYHFADSYGPDDEMSIELSLEDVKRVAYHYGFVMEAEKMIDTTYAVNRASMMQNRYRAAFWTMRKVASRSKAQKSKA